MITEQQKRKRVLYQRKKLREETKVKKFLDRMSFRRLVTQNPTPKLVRGFRIRRRNAVQIMLGTIDESILLSKYGVDVHNPSYQIQIQQLRQAVLEAYPELAEIQRG